MTVRETKQSSTEVPELTAAERAALNKYLARSEAKPPVRFNVSKESDATKVVFDDPKRLGPALLMDSLGSGDIEFVNGIIRQLANASSIGNEIIERDLNFLVSVIKGIEPRDQLEAMLAAQMAVVHVASMSLAKDRALIEMIPQQDSWERAFNKLVRTFAMQMEALTRYRARVEHKITPENASAAKEGQPSAGTVRQACGEKITTSPAPSVTETNVVPMPKLDKSKERTPSPTRRKPAA
jgi:hypothetical protein